MAEYRLEAHAVYDSKDHLIWITKYRYKVLRGRVAERAREVVVIRGAISPDHVQMLVSAPRRLAPSKLVQYIKGGSSRRLRDEFAGLRKRYWRRHLWARGYFCATGGAVDEETIKKYIESQQWHDDCGGLQDYSAHQALSRLWSRGYFRRLQPQADFQSKLNLPYRL